MASDRGPGESSSIGAARGGMGVGVSQDLTRRGIEMQASANPTFAELHQQIMQQHLQQQHSLLLAAASAPAVSSHLTKGQHPGAINSQANSLMLQNLLRQQIMVFLFPLALRAGMRCSRIFCRFDRNQHCLGTVN